MSTELAGGLSRQQGNPLG